MGDSKYRPGPIFPYDGILGLSPNVDGDSVLSLGVPIPLHLKRTNKIARGVVGIDMRRDGVGSTITFGRIDTIRFRNKTETEATLKWFLIPSNNQRYAWRHEMKDVFYDRKSFDDDYVN